LVNKFSDSLVADSVGSNETKLYQTDLISIQVAKSDTESHKQANEEAIAKNLSLINFTDCQTLLQNTGVIAKNDSLIFSKTDWNADLKTSDTLNENSTKIDSVSYSLFSLKGVKIDMNLCKSTETNIQIQIKGLNTTDLGNGELYDINSAYYNDRCKIMPKNQSAVTINQKRSQFSSLNYTCGSKCSYQAIDLNSSYISCNCNSSQSNIEVSPEIGNIMLQTLDSVNAILITCYQDFLLYVIFYFNYSLKS